MLSLSVSPLPSFRFARSSHTYLRPKPYNAPFLLLEADRRPQVTSVDSGFSCAFTDGHCLPRCCLHDAHPFRLWSRGRGSTRAFISWLVLPTQSVGVS